MDNSLYGKLKQTEKKQSEIETENNKLKQENLELKLALVESEETRLTDSLEIKLAIAELAEVVISG